VFQLFQPGKGQLISSVDTTTLLDDRLMTYPLPPDWDCQDGLDYRRVNFDAIKDWVKLLSHRHIDRYLSADTAIVDAA
jgi:hypothetical protein